MAHFLVSPEEFENILILSSESGDLDEPGPEECWKIVSFPFQIGHSIPEFPNSRCDLQ